MTFIDLYQNILKENSSPAIWPSVYPSLNSILLQEINQKIDLVCFIWFKEAKERKRWSVAIKMTSNRIKHVKHTSSMLDNLFGWWWWGDKSWALIKIPRYQFTQCTSKYRPSKACMFWFGWPLTFLQIVAV